MSEYFSNPETWPESLKELVKKIDDAEKATQTLVKEQRKKLKALYDEIQGLKKSSNTPQKGEGDRNLEPGAVPGEVDRLKRWLEERLPRRSGGGIFSWGSGGASEKLPTEAPRPAGGFPLAEMRALLAEVDDNPLLAVTDRLPELFDTFETLLQSCDRLAPESPEENVELGEACRFAEGKYRYWQECLEIRRFPEVGEPFDYTVATAVHWQPTADETLHNRVAEVREYGFEWPHKPNPLRMAKVVVWGPESVE